MDIIIENIDLLKSRIKDFVEASEYVLKNRKDLYWSTHEAVKGGVRKVSFLSVKKAYKEGCIDRYNRVLKCLESNTLSQVDWIEVRDVLYWVCFEIDMKGEKSYKTLRESTKDIVITEVKSQEQFEENKRIHTGRV